MTPRQLTALSGQHNKQNNGKAGPTKGTPTDLFALSAMPVRG